MNAVTLSATATDLAPPRRFALPRNALLVGGFALIIAIIGIVWLRAPRSSETTDNAYLQADSSAVAPRVAGLVAEVLVKDNQLVKAGDPLVRIDAQDYETKVDAARAAVADADAGVATARAELAALGADDRLAAAKVRAAGTGIASADAESARAAIDRARYDALAAKGFATRRDAERVNAVAIGAISAATRSRAELGVTSEEAGVARARRPVLAARVEAAQAAALKARAGLALARQDSTHTAVVAPFAGVIGDRHVQVGDYVQPGSRLLTLVPVGSLYVIANFKETQVSGMRAGQKVDVYVDALGGDPLIGAIESFAPGSGSEFTLLPFEPGSGNFTKIVQRVGVRIRLDPAQQALAKLRPGLSVTATVQLR